MGGCGKSDRECVVTYVHAVMHLDKINSGIYFANATQFDVHCTSRQVLLCQKTEDGFM